MFRSCRRCVRHFVQDALLERTRFFCHTVRSVDRHACHMTCLSTYSSSAQSAHMHIHSSREHAWLKSAQFRIARICVSKKIPSSTRHVSSLAALVTEHIYTFSLTYLTYLPVFLSLKVPFVGAGSTYLH